MAKKRNKKIHKFKILFYTLIVGVFIYYCIDHKIAKDSLIKKYRIFNCYNHRFPNRKNWEIWS